MQMRINFIFECAGIMDKYDYIILPPDAFHMTLRDRRVVAQQMMEDALDVVEGIRGDGQRVLVKYRTAKQLVKFPCSAESKVGYGRLLDYCTDSTIVIGFPGSSPLLERLLNDGLFYAFWDYRNYLDNRYISMEAVTRLLNVIYIARNKEELRENILAGKIFKPGHSKEDLLYSDGIYPHEIIHEILMRQNVEMSE